MPHCGQGVSRRSRGALPAGRVAGAATGGAGGATRGAIRPGTRDNGSRHPSPCGDTPGTPAEKLPSLGTPRPGQRPDAADNEPPGGHHPGVQREEHSPRPLAHPTASGQGVYSTRPSQGIRFSLTEAGGNSSGKGGLAAGGAPGPRVARQNRGNRYRRQVAWRELAPQSIFSQAQGRAGGKLKKFPRFSNRHDPPSRIVSWGPAGCFSLSLHPVFF